MRLHGSCFGRWLLGHQRLREERTQWRVIERFGKQRVSLGTTVEKFVASGLPLLVAGRGGIDLGTCHAVRVVWHAHQHIAGRRDYHAAAGIIDTALDAGFGCGDEPYAILKRTRRHPHLGLIHGEEIGHVDDDLSAL